MLQELTPQQLLEFQIKHYEERLKESTKVKERMFLRDELHRIKKYS